MMIRKSYRDIAAQSLGKPLLFGHDLRQLFGYEQVGKKLTEPDVYEQRSLAIGGRKDIVALQFHPGPACLQYFRDDLDIGHNRILVTGSTRSLPDYLNQSQDGRSVGLGSEVTAKELEEIVASGSHLFMPYMGTEHEAGTKLSSFGTGDNDLVKQFYNKIKFKRAVANLGIPVIKEDSVLDNPGQYTASELIPELKNILNKLGGSDSRVFYREAGLASGAGNGEITVDGRNNSITIEQASEMFANAAANHQYLLEPFVKATSSPSVIGVVDMSGEPHLLGKSQQLLNKDSAQSHGGNWFVFDESPHHGDIYNYSIQMAAVMAGAGYRGGFGFDFIETKNGEHVPIECNARVTGSFYPYELRQRLADVGRDFTHAVLWHADLGASYSGFESFRKEYDSTLLSSNSADGIVPLIPGLIKGGKFQGVIMADTRERVGEIQENFLRVAENTVKHKTEAPVLKHYAS